MVINYWDYFWYCLCIIIVYELCYETKMHAYDWYGDPKGAI